MFFYRMPGYKSKMQITGIIYVICQTQF